MPWRRGRRTGKGRLKAGALEGGGISEGVLSADGCTEGGDGVDGVRVAHEEQDARGREAAVGEGGAASGGVAERVARGEASRGDVGVQRPAQ